jgi:hypothetical protein
MKKLVTHTNPHHENLLTEVTSFVLHGIPLQTGDLVCTVNGTDSTLPGQFWRLIAQLVPGEVDHVIVYTGPGGRFVEAGPRGVNTFVIEAPVWDSIQMSNLRGPYLDTLYGIAYPLAGRGFLPEQERRIRLAVGHYCLRLAGQNIPYNINFLNSETEEAFYCSQLAYAAYRPHGIDLNTGLGVRDLPGSESIIFPQEIWEGCMHTKLW